MTEFLRDWFCGRCGSNDVTKSATVRFSPNTQQWEVSSVFDDLECVGCGYEGRAFHFEKYDEAILLMNDQPVTCPHCGSRTDWDDSEVGVGMQLHVCLNPICGVWFRVEEDDEEDEDEDVRTPDADQP